jgi:RNA polymerase sigma-70 factor (ECF subfamily)
LKNIANVNCFIINSKTVGYGFYRGEISRRFAAAIFLREAEYLGKSMSSVKGTDEYIAETVEKYSDTLLRLCYTYVKNSSDAEDITQDVFLSLLKREAPFESAEHEKAWLLRLAINKCKNHLKSGWIRHNTPLDDTLSENIPDEHFTGENTVLEAVMALPEKYRTPIHLFYYNELSIKEIAAAIGKKEATVGTLLARGRKLLKDSMIGGISDE